MKFEYLYHQGSNYVKMRTVGTVSHTEESDIIFQVQIIIQSIKALLHKHFAEIIWVWVGRRKRENKDF